MIVTKIEPVTKVKFKVFIDEQFAFVLYKGELSRYHMKMGADLEEDFFLKIKKEVILKRAKLRSMHLLNDMDRSESSLREKLRQCFYTGDIIDAAVEYVRSFGYIDDHRFALRFVESKKNSKSKKEIYAALCQKGIEQATIDMAMEEQFNASTEQAAIAQLLRKKRFDPAQAEGTDIQKIYGYLARKGFQYSDIRQVVQYSDENA